MPSASSCLSMKANESFVSSKPSVSLMSGAFACAFCVSGRDYVLGVVCHPITVVDGLEVITAKERALALAPRKIATTEEMMSEAPEEGEPLEGGA